MKNLYILIATFGLTSWVIAMDYPELDPNTNVTISTTDGKKFSTYLKHLKCSGTINDMLEVFENKSTHEPIPIVTTSDEWPLVEELLSHAFNIKNTPSNLTDFKTYLKNQSDISTINKLADFFNISDIEQSILGEVNNRLLNNINHFAVSENPEQYNPFNLTSLQTVALAQSIMKKCIANNVIPIIPCLATIRNHTSNINSIAFSSKTLASGDAHTIKLWNPHNPQHSLITTIDQHSGGHTNWVQCLVFNPNGTMLASGSSDHTIKLWIYNPKVR